MYKILFANICQGKYSEKNLILIYLFNKLEIFEKTSKYYVKKLEN